MTTLIRNVFTRRAAVISRLAWLARSPNRWTRSAFIYTLSDYFDGDFEKNGRRIYQVHYDSVRSAAAELKMELLEYQVQEGWGPLCQFLGHDMPCRPFPTGNTKDEANGRINSLVNSEVRRLILVFSVLSLIVLLWRAFILACITYFLPRHRASSHS
jgi:hypothetical protein